MRIRSIHIDGFGIWNDRTWGPLSDGVNVFSGPNEAGKTTLMSFIRSVLFGFERRAHPRRYEPTNGGDYGGWLDIEWNQSGARVIRRSGRHVRGSVEVRKAGEEGEFFVEEGQNPEAVLEAMLGGTTRTLYHNVFAFGLEELEHFRTLEESEVASHISGAGMGVGARRWSRVWRDLEDRQSGLYLPRGQNATLNQAFRELEDVREELDRTAEESEDYFRTLAERDALVVETERLEAEVNAISVRLEHYRKVSEAEPYRLRRDALRTELGKLDDIPRFPENGVERLNFLFDQRRGIETEIELVRTAIARVREERREVSREYAPQDLIRRSRNVDSLRMLLPRRDAGEEVIAGAMARRDAVVLERNRVESRQRALAPPAAASMAILSALIGITGASLAYSGYSLAPWIASATLGILVIWYYLRRRMASRLDSEIADCDERLGEAQGNLERVEAEARKVVGSIERLVGRSDYSYVDLETEALRVAELTALAERLRSIEERLESEEARRERLEVQLADANERIRVLLAEGDANSDSDFFRRAGIFGRRRELLAELDRTPAPVVDPPEGDLEPLDAATFREASEAHDQLVRLLREAQTDSGRLEERLTTLSRSEQRSRARLHHESLMARIDEASEKWAVVTLCRSLLSDTRQIYETERQPEVLRAASEFFSSMTGGHWVRVISPLESGLLVESEAGDRVSPENLSRGTGEQLYLAMRLALVREYSRHVRPLPVVLDDIFVNFDPQRTRRSIEAIGKLSESHQVLLFTCHPHLVRIVEEILPSAELYPLQ